MTGFTNLPELTRSRISAAGELMCEAFNGIKDPAMLVPISKALARELAGAINYGVDGFDPGTEGECRRAAGKYLKED